MNEKKKKIIPDNKVKSVFHTISEFDSVLGKEFRVKRRWIDRRKGRRRRNMRRNIVIIKDSKRKGEHYPLLAEVETAPRMIMHQPDQRMFIIDKGKEEL